MLKPLLDRLTDALLHSPKIFIWGGLIPAMLLTAVAAFVPMDLSFTGILNREDELVVDYLEAAEELSLGGRLPLLLQGDESKLDDAVRAIEAGLKDNPDVKSVLTPPSTDWMVKNAPYLVEEEIFADWLAVASADSDRDVVDRLAAELKKLKEKIEQSAPKGARLMVLLLAHDPLAEAAGGVGYFRLEDRTREILAPFGVEFAYAGLAAITAQDQSSTLRVVTILSPLSLLFVLLLFRFTERRLLRLIAIAIPMILALGATLGIVGFITSKITIMETFFGIMVVGLGVDFALHLVVRLREERALGHSFEDALRLTICGAGTGIISGGLTTAGAFFIVAVAPDPVALHLGLSGGIGLLLCLFLMLTLLPAAWILMHRRDHKEVTLLSPLPIPFVGKLAELSQRSPVTTFLIGCAIVIVSLAGVPRFQFETDLQKIFNRNVPALDTVDKITELFHVNPGPWISKVSTIEEAHRLQKEFLKDPEFVEAESIALFLRPDRNARAALLKNAQEDIATQKLIYRSLQVVATEEEVEESEWLIKLIEGLEEAGQTGPPTLESLPESLRAGFVAPSGEYLVMAYGKDTNMDGYLAQRERLAAQAIAPDAIGAGAALEAIMVGNRGWAIPIFLAILFFVSILLVIDMRSARWVLVAVTPVLCGTSVAVGLLCWAGVSFNIYTTLVIPLIIGLGVDDGIHMVHRMRESKDLQFWQSVESVGRAIVMTTLTTCASFFILLFTDHPGMEGMAKIILIGLPVCLLASITMIPALAKLLRLRPGR